MSHGCHDLECLLLGRGGAPNPGLKITDVALLALGERCQALQELVLTNCSHLTDGGLHWLTESCKQLRKLDLENCNKLTNAGKLCLDILPTTHNPQHAPTNPNPTPPPHKESGPWPRCATSSRG